MYTTPLLAKMKMQICECIYICIMYPYVCADMYALICMFVCFYVHVHIYNSIYILYSYVCVYVFVILCIYT